MEGCVEGQGDRGQGAGGSRSKLANQGIPTRIIQISEYKYVQDILGF